MNAILSFCVPCRRLFLDFVVLLRAPPNPATLQVSCQTGQLKQFSLLCTRLNRVFDKIRSLLSDP